MPLMLQATDDTPHAAPAKQHNGWPQSWRVPVLSAALAAAAAAAEIGMLSWRLSMKLSLSVAVSSQTKLKTGGVRHSSAQLRRCLLAFDVRDIYIYI